MIIDWLLGLASWIRQLWNRLDEKTKRQIIDAIVKAFGELLRAFYIEWKNRSGE